jgi:Tol biopolymer transport system component
MWSASRTTRIVLFVATAALSSALSLTISSPHAQFPGSNGKIAFHRQDANTAKFEIWTVNPDGSDPTLLTGSLGDSSRPDWSPSGTKIAFESVPGPSVNTDVYVMDADGSDAVNLTNNSAYDSSPAWSPDGQRIAFTSRRTGVSQIWVMNSDGSDQTQLTFSLISKHGPEWSPDGTRIAYYANAAGWDIFTMTSDGTSVSQVTTDPAEDTNPEWSPAGDRIIFLSNRDGGLDIWEMNSDGTAQTQVTDEVPPKGNRMADISPDGNYIVYSKEPSGGQHEWRLWIASRDGSNEYAITSVFRDDEPDWQVTPESETPAPTPPYTPTSTPLASPTSSPTPTSGSTTDSPPTPTSVAAVGGAVDLVVQRDSNSGGAGGAPLAILGTLIAIPVLFSGGAVLAARTYRRRG